jgi:hypothetical protein
MSPVVDPILIKQELLPNNAAMRSRQNVRVFGLRQSTIRRKSPRRFIRLCQKNLTDSCEKLDKADVFPKRGIDTTGHDATTLTTVSHLATRNADITSRKRCSAKRTTDNVACVD